MNKKQFLDALREALPQTSTGDLNDIMADFEEHFASAAAHGKSEAEICAELGSPREIARQYLDGWQDRTVDPSTFPAAQNRPAANVLKPHPAVAAAAEPAASGQGQSLAHATGKLDGGALIAVIVLNLLIGLPVWISLFSTLIGLWAAAGGIGTAALALFVIAVVQAGVTSLILALFGISLTALTVLAVILMVYLTKWLCLGLVKYIQWNRKLVMGGQAA